MLIRTEAPADSIAINDLLNKAFPTPAEAKLVSQLRENGHITLSVVASDDEGRIVGCAQFSPVTINGDDFGWQGLAPVAVDEAYRKQGIAEKMIRLGLESLFELGYPVCVVVGDPAYYSRFGFVSGDKHQLRTPWELPEGIFQVFDLTDNQLQGYSGLIEYCDEFNQL